MKHHLTRHLTRYCYGCKNEWLSDNKKCKTCCRLARTDNFEQEEYNKNKK